MDASWIKAWGLFGVIVAEVFGTTLIGAGVGYWGYQHWSFPLWFAAILGMIGFGAAITRLAVRLKPKKETA